MQLKLLQKRYHSSKDANQNKWRRVTKKRFYELVKASHFHHWLDI